MDKKLQVWLTERQIYFNRYGMYLIAMSLFFVGYASATELRYFLAITSQIITPLFALDIVPVSLRLEQLGKELREEVGLRKTTLSAKGGVLFTLFWVIIWGYLARRAGVSPYIYYSLGGVGILVIAVAAVKYSRSTKHT